MSETMFTGFLENINWHEMFVPHSLLEIFIRGSFVYLALFVLLRIFQRGTSNISMTDLLLMVLIADASQNAMAGGYKSIPEGIFLVLTLILWNLALDWLGYKFPSFGRFMQPPARTLIKDGKVISHNLRREFITPQELMAQLHENGVEELSEVKVAYLEGDGKFTLIKKKKS